MYLSGTQSRIEQKLSRTFLFRVSVLHSTVDFSTHVKLGVSNISCKCAHQHPAKHPTPNYLDLTISERNTPSTVVFDGSDFDYCKVGLTPETTNLKVR